MGSVDPAALTEGLDELDARALAARLGVIEQAIRALHAASAAVIAEADRKQACAEDGHASVRGWVKASVRLSNVEVTNRVRTAKLVTALPELGHALASGALGVAQAGELARLHANPRCGEQLGTVADALLEYATSLPYETFTKVTRHFERLADADGAHRGHEQIDRARRADVTTVDDTTYVSARVGAAQGARLREVFDAFVHAELAADWDDVRARLGDDATPGDMARTESQRRADALVAIFEAAAGAGPPTGQRVPVVNIVIDQSVFEEQLVAIVDERDPVFEVDDAVHTRCHTTSGIPVDPADGVAAALVGHVRRVVLGGDGVIIDLGRRSRLFTGSARSAAWLQAALDGERCCSWPGCTQRRCELDHSDEWVADQGCTNVRNSGPKCGRHNRWKSRGYRTWRDPTGGWHTQRPDGSEIAPI